MSQTVVTNVVLVSANEVSDEDAEQLMEAHGADSLSEVAESMEESVEAIMAKQFREADEIILNVSTDVDEEWSEEDAEKRVN